MITSINKISLKNIKLRLLILNKSFMNKLLAIFLISIYSCQEKPKISESSQGNLSSKAVSTSNSIDLVTENKAEYHQFKADTLTNLNIPGFEILASYQLKNLKIAEGYYKPVDGIMVAPDTERDQGRRLLILNNKNEIISKSKGVGEVYLNQPYFYKNNANDNILIVCQLAYEYYFGAEAYLLQNDRLKYIGNIDIESKNMEISLIEILRINENKKIITFSFDSDSILLKPGDKDELVRNNNLRYEYDYKTFRLKK